MRHVVDGGNGPLNLFPDRFNSMSALYCANMSGGNAPDSWLKDKLRH